MQRGDVALRVEAGRQLALRDRVVAAVQHVLFARPDQLDRRAGHLLRDRHRLAHPVVHCAAPAEAAAQQQLVDLALRERQAGGFGGRGERRLAVLRRRPDFAALRRPARRGVHRLHRRVVLVRVRVHRLDLARRRGERRARIADWLPTTASLRVEPGLQHRGELGAREPSRSGPRPIRSAARRARVFACHQVSATTATARVADAHDLLHAGRFDRAAASKLFTLPPKPGSP